MKIITWNLFNVILLFRFLIWKLVRIIIQKKVFKYSTYQLCEQRFNKCRIPLFPPEVASLVSLLPHCWKCFSRWLSNIAGMKISMIKRRKVLNVKIALEDFKRRIIFVKLPKEIIEKKTNPPLFSTLLIKILH